MDERIERLRRVLREKELDGVLITSAVHIRYISGFTSGDGVVLVTADGLWLFTDFRYTIQAKEQLRAGFCCVEITAATMYETVGETIRAAGAKAVGFEQEAVTCAVYEKLKPLATRLVPFSEQLSHLRIVKSTDEIEKLQAAQAIADKAFSELLTRVCPGMSEREVRAELLYICGRFGSDGPSFDPIVGSGPNGAMCHAVPGERRLSEGDLVVLDFGCLVDGYCSDMTRTFGIGKIDEELIKVYDIVREAQQRALDGLHAGVGGKALDAIARDYIASKGYGEAFGHSLGHGFGLEIHEAPNASVRSEYTLEAGMTITVEPGIYLEGKGGVRIEDCCVVTKEGCINLVTSTKELQII